MRLAMIALLGFGAVSTASLAGKPVSNANPQIAYRVLSGNSVKLMVADESGANATALFSSSGSFNYDIAPASQRQIAIATRAGELLLVSYVRNSNGSLQASGTPQLLTTSSASTAVDFSPDGRKIAYACCGNEPLSLRVYDLDTGTSTEWGTFNYVWDVAFFRNGSSIAVVDPQSSGVGQDLVEITGPSASHNVIFHDDSQLYIDASRTNSDALILSYHQGPNAYVGLWQAPVGSETSGHFLVPNLTNRSVAFFGTLSCDDRKVGYGSSIGPQGAQAYYVRNLETNQDSLFSKSSNIAMQFWPTCM